MSRKPSRSTFRLRLDEMVTTLRDEMITGKREIGEYLPSEMDLGDQFQLSKNSIRKGLDILVSEGYIEKIPRVGNKVVKAATESTVTIKFGYHPSLAKEAELHQLLADFHKEYPHIRVQTIMLPYGEGYHETTKEYISNEMIDVMTINYSDYQQFVEGDCLDLLEPFEENQEVYPFLTRSFLHDQKLMVQPFIFSPIILCYNRDHLNNKQLPEPDSSWTWDNLLSSAAKLADEKEGRFGFYFHMLSYNRWPVFVLQSGMKFERDGSGKYRISQTKLSDSLNVCRELIYQQGISPAFLSESDDDAEDLFLNEKTSIIMTTYFSLNNIRDADFNYDVAPLPYLYEPRSLLLIIGLAVISNSRHKEAAQTLVNYLLSYSAQLKIRQKTLSIPSLKPAAEWTGKEGIKRPSRFHMYREIMPSFRLFTDLNLNSIELGKVRGELKLFWSRMEEIDAVCKRLEELL
jgi:multiple sugar transport system substrate-binding protein